MPVLKCKMCGGDIIFTGETAVGRCDCCGSATTLPTVGEERLTNLFNRANSLRLRGEFDRATTTYERILSEDDTSAEAHWGIVLCHYGIEYVEDPDSHRRVPTCRLAQRDSILQHEDYLAALQHADPAAKEFYEKEAAYIDAVQKHIHMLSRSEDPYDIFICYKESTDTGERTKASVLAQDLYVQLSKEGYRVFFSRITLEDKLGQQYEPYIFAALNSAKVMLVVGTEPDQFTAPWVRNEWSRFLLLLKEGSDRRLIPCYRDMDPYDLPDELSLLQCQDMSRIGFEQDLLRGLQKLLRKDTMAGTASYHPTDVSALLRRGQLFLEDRNWEAATASFDKALDIVPECADAYIGRLCAEVKSSNLEEIVPTYKYEMNYGADPIKAVITWVPLSSRTDYTKAVRFADSETCEKLKRCCQEVAEIIKAYKVEKKQTMSDAIDEIKAQIAQRTRDIDEGTQRIQNGEKTLQQLREALGKLPHKRESLMIETAKTDHSSAGIVAFLIPILGFLTMNSIGLAVVGFWAGLVIGIIYYRTRTSSIDQKSGELKEQIAHQKNELSETSKSVRNLETERAALTNQLQPLQKRYTDFLSLTARR